MKREFTIDGKTLQIEIAESPLGEPFTVKVNSKPRQVTLEETPEEAKNFLIKVDRKSYQVELLSSDRTSLFSIKVNNVPFKVELKTAAPKMVAVAPTVLVPSRATKQLGEGVVAAPMAGKIVSVKVRKGVSVKAGAVLCVLEAMKMENEITSPKAGVVDEVKVQEGMAVKEGDVLVLVK